MGMGIVSVYVTKHIEPRRSRPELCFVMEWVLLNILTLLGASSCDGMAVEYPNLIGC
jgi:hypothetical protein